jgi:N-acetylmuramoyl-L-alanine amidase
MKTVHTIRRVLTAIAVTVLLVLAGQDAWARNQASALRIGSHPDGITRFVVDLADNLDFTLASFTNPNRIEVSVPAMEWTAPRHRPVGSVRDIVYAPAGEGGRIVVSLKDPALVKAAFVIPPRDGLGWRFVMDLQQSSVVAFAAASVPFKAPLPKATAPVGAQPAAPVAVMGPGRSIVVYSPEVKPPVSAVPNAAPAPVSVQPVVTVPPPAPVVSEAKKASPPVDLRPSPQVAQRPARSGSPVLSAPVPPPLIRAPEPVKQDDPPVAAKAVPLPQEEPVKLAALKVPEPELAPQPEQKTRPTNSTPVIVIDPGHGGADPGAIGVSGIYEKYITLAMARELKRRLEKGGRFKVHLTRNRDVFIRLRDRVAIGRQLGADLFISLHADSVGNPSLSGLSVYTLSQTASDTEAQTLADKENKADLIAGIDLSHESADVANILIDLAQRETMNRSALFASGVVDEVGRETPLLRNTHRFAGFAVLKAPDVPSILVELGYLSNETEERNLRQPAYRAKLAQAVAAAVDHFFLRDQKARR